jgi:hypothetical protein
MLPGRVKKSDWKTLPCPTLRERLDLELLLTETDAEKVMMGHRPRGMDDKWFIYFEDGWLYFHRSWTGSAIYGLRLDGSPAGVRVTDSWVSRDPEQYNETRTEYDRQMVRFVMDTILLHRHAQFPTPPEAAAVPAGVFQHHISGSGYPEVLAATATGDSSPASLTTSGRPEVSPATSSPSLLARLLRWFHAS